jgi:hypothetical protein
MYFEVFTNRILKSFHLFFKAQKAFCVFIFTHSDKNIVFLVNLAEKMEQSNDHWVRSYPASKKG